MKPSKAKNSKPRTKTNGRGSLDITSVILRHHKDIKKLVFILKRANVGISKKLPAYAKFKIILSNHSQAEQESLYIRMKEQDKLRIEGLEGDVEHGLADQLMKEINLIKDDNDSWMAKVKVLAELVDHHVKEEEKSVLSQVRKIFDKDMRITIGREYLNLFNQKSSDQNFKVKIKEITHAQGEYV